MKLEQFMDYFTIGFISLLTIWVFIIAMALAIKSGMILVYVWAIGLTGCLVIIIYYMIKIKQTVDSIGGKN